MLKTLPRDNSGPPADGPSVGRFLAYARNLITRNGCVLGVCGFQIQAFARRHSGSSGSGSHNRRGFVMLTGTFGVPVNHTTRILMQLLFVVFSCFRDVGLVAGFGHSLHKRVSACGG